MMRVPLLLALWTALVSVASAQFRPAELTVPSRSDALVRGYRLADELFVPVERLPELGWSGVVRKDQVDVRAGGKTFSLPYRVFAGSQSVPIRRAAQRLGAYTEWALSRDRLRLLNVVTAVETDDERVTFRFALPAVGGRVRLADNYIELTGFRPLAPTLRLPRGARTVAQPGVVQVIFDAPRQGGRINEDGTAYTLDARASSTPAPVRHAQTDPVPEAASTVVALLPNLESSRATLLSLRVDPAPERAPILKALDALYAEIELPGVSADLASDFALPTRLLRDVKVDRTRTGSVIRLFLRDPVAIELLDTDDGYLLQLSAPMARGKRKLSDMTVVVDAGHGAHDGGARSGGIREKDLTLAIALKLARELEDEGAKVILTRDTDVFIPLSRRAKIANDANADFFISVHINSTGGKANQSGSITFFHGPNATKELLARCIQQEIAEISKLPNIGVWSDKRIYGSGFAVLRETKMPGVLLELGFINHPRDRGRMVQRDFQDATAKAVVRGLKVFLGEAKPSS